jgi:pilus assembly protein Flp/PilA
MLSQFMLWFKTFVQTEEEGQTLVEYALLLVLIALVVVVVLLTLGPAIAQIYTNIQTALQ